MNWFCGKILSEPLFKIVIKEKGCVLCYRKSWFGCSLSCLFSSIFLVNGYIILLAGADTFAIVGLQLVGFHEMGRRESIRGRKGNV